MHTGEVIYDGSSFRSYFLRSSAEKECKEVNDTRLFEGERDWTFYVHDRQE